jgi:protein-tyrosine phosphatase
MGESDTRTLRVLFVCLGNICRSPTAEGVMRHLVERHGVQEQIEIDSAGTGGWHVGEPADPRARAAAHSRGIVLDGVARQVTPEDFDRFDLIVAMDSSNVSSLERIAPDEPAREKIHLLREYDPGSAGARDLDVPDPYYDGARGFETVLDQVEAACEGLLAHVRASEPA